MQEFVPGGRQQALRHPGPLETRFKKSPGEDDFLSKKFKKVSLHEKQNEWWILRKVKATFVTNVHEQEFVKSEVSNKSYNHQSIYKTRHSELIDESSGFRTGIETSFNKFGKRVSDTSVLKTPNKRISLESIQKNDTKQVLDSGKFHIGKLYLVNFHFINTSFEKVILTNFIFLCLSTVHI